MRIVILSVSLAALAFLAPSHARAEFTGPGKNSAFASADGSAFPTVPTPIAAVAIQQGKSKRVLEIAATTQVVNATPGIGTFYVQVNGVNVEPTNGGILALAQHCDSTCAISGNWWLDLDAAETANPGTIVGEELQVVLYGYNNFIGGPFVPYTTTLSAKLVKK